MPTAAVIASVRSSLFIYTDLKEKYSIDVPLARSIKGTHGGRRPPCVHVSFGSSASSHPLWNRRVGPRRDTADVRCARRKRRSRDKELITLDRCQTSGHALTRKGIDVGVRCCETVREGLQEGHDQILLLIRQAEITDRHVNVVWDLGHGPAVHLFSRSRR